MAIQILSCHEAGREFQVGGRPPQLGVEVCSLWPGLVFLGCEEGTVLQNVGWGLFGLRAGTQCRVGKVQSSQVGTDTTMASAQAVANSMGGS